MAKLRETILCLQAVAPHVKAKGAVLTVVVSALEKSKKLLDEATLGGDVDLATFDDTILINLDARLVESKVDLEALKARHVLPLSFGPRSEALEGIERSAVLEGIDPSLRANREEMAALDDVVRRELRVPVGHTSYSWHGTTGRTPIGHTAYSSPPLAGGKHPLLALREVLADIREYERGDAFRKFLVRGVAGQQGGEYSKTNFSYGTTR